MRRAAAVRPERQRAAAVAATAAAAASAASVLNADNLVGLAYIADPACSPREHAPDAAALIDAFSAGAGGAARFTMGVFALHAPHGTTGELLTTQAPLPPPGEGGEGGEGEATRRLLTFEEFATARACER